MRNIKLLCVVLLTILLWSCKSRDYYEEGYRYKIIFDRGSQQVCVLTEEYPYKGTDGCIYADGIYDCGCSKDEVFQGTICGNYQIMEIQHEGK
jgi:nitrogen fixation-related uncharacterized protein